jgi:hypothetical protein
MPPTSQDAQQAPWGRLPRVHSSHLGGSLLPGTVPGVRGPAQPAPLPAVLGVHLNVQPVPAYHGLEAVAAPQTRPEVGAARGSVCLPIMQ